MSNNKLYIDKILKSCPLCKDEPGIYILTRQENNKKFAIIGSSKKVLSALVNHLENNYAIDKVIQQYGLIYNDNLSGWVIKCISVNESSFVEAKDKYSKFYYENGYTCMKVTNYE